MIRGRRRGVRERHIVRLLASFFCLFIGLFASSCCYDVLYYCCTRYTSYRVCMVVAASREGGTYCCTAVPPSLPSLLCIYCLSLSPLSSADPFAHILCVNDGGDDDDERERKRSTTYGRTAPRYVGRTGVRRSTRANNA